MRLLASTIVSQKRSEAVFEAAAKEEEEEVLRDVKNFFSTKVDKIKERRS